MPGLPLAGIAINMYLMSGLSMQVWIRFLVWLALGGILYWLWGYRSAGRVIAAREAAVPTAGEVLVEPS
ncbi:hypothetical protein D3C87_2111000 [compost metagenome]